MFLIACGIMLYRFNTDAPSSKTRLASTDAPATDNQAGLSPKQPAAQMQSRTSGNTGGILSQNEYDKFISILINNLLSRHETDSGSKIQADSVTDPDRIDMHLSETIPMSLFQERSEIQHLFRTMLEELQRWNHFQADQYGNMLDNRTEPTMFDTEMLDLADPENAQYFNELENALKLHLRMIRDVRTFHAEVQFTRTQAAAQHPYQPFELKYKLAPFARESAIADALLQAMSAMSSGVHEQEASEVINRLVDEFTKPVRRVYDPPQTEQNSASTPVESYNFNIYVLYGKKILRYADLLSDQTIIATTASGRAEMDYIGRELRQSFRDLQEAGQNQMLSSSQLDLSNLE